jgi:hypothetical protein
LVLLSTVVGLVGYIWGRHDTRLLSDNHHGRLRQPSWPVGLNGRRVCPSGGQSHRPHSFSG